MTSIFSNFRGARKKRENWKVGAATEDGFVTLERVEIKRNFVIPKAGKGRDVPPGPAPKGGLPPVPGAVEASVPEAAELPRAFVIASEKEVRVLRFPKSSQTRQTSTELPLAPLARHLLDVGPTRGDSVPVDFALLGLGRLRALQFELHRFNSARRPVDGKRFLEICSSCGVKVGERPVQVEDLH